MRAGVRASSRLEVRLRLTVLACEPLGLRGLVAYNPRRATSARALAPANVAAITRSARAAAEHCRGVGRAVDGDQGVAHLSIEEPIPTELPAAIAHRPGGLIGWGR